jgi:hypothetical protein
MLYKDLEDKIESFVVCSRQDDGGLKVRKVNISLDPVIAEKLRLLLCQCSDPTQFGLTLNKEIGLICDELQYQIYNQLQTKI